MMEAKLFSRAAVAAATSSAVSSDRGTLAGLIAFPPDRKVTSVMQASGAASAVVLAAAEFAPAVLVALGIFAVTRDAFSVPWTPHTSTVIAVSVEQGTGWEILLSEYWI
jgi:hypothetical protein